jgi:hypothetical protein
MNSKHKKLAQAIEQTTESRSRKPIMPIGNDGNGQGGWDNSDIGRIGASSFSFKI